MVTIKLLILLKKIGLCTFAAICAAMPFGLVFMERWRGGLGEGGGFEGVVGATGLEGSGEGGLGWPRGGASRASGSSGGGIRGPVAFRGGLL